MPHATFPPPRGRDHMKQFLILVPLALLAACNSQSSDKAEPAADDTSSAATPVPPQPNETSPPDQPAAAWDLASSGEGASLVFPAFGDPAIRLFCPARKGEILVNIPAFRPIGSEERLSFGSGGAVHTLVADTSGDRQRGGVSGTGAVPGNLGALIGGPVSVNYGAQNSGPHPAPPQELARAFIAACGKGAPDPTPGPAPKPAAGNISACLMQDGRRLAVTPLRAVGTEPFWGARIEGRCVTYSHPEDQQGTRVWTRYSANSGGGTWTGALGGQRFILTSRPQPGCSDGMSDKRYPLAVALTVGGEQRRGCAGPL